MNGQLTLPELLAKLPPICQCPHKVGPHIEVQSCRDWDEDIERLITSHLRNRRQ